MTTADSTTEPTRAVQPTETLPDVTVLSEFLRGTPLLKDEVIILTGAAGGIGRTVAPILAAAGARVGLTDLRGSQVQRVHAELVEMSAVAVEAEFDASDGESFERFHTRVENELGAVTGLVNCAGLWRPAPYDELLGPAWDATINANLATAFVGCATVLPGMVERRRGSVVNFASTAGEYGSIRPAAHYAAAKAGVIGLTKSLAREVGFANVRVNAISPGPIDTEGLLASDAEKDVIAERTLLGRLGSPEEIACGCVYLLSQLSTFVTGHVLRVNGGSLL